VTPKPCPRELRSLLVALVAVLLTLGLSALAAAQSVDLYVPPKPAVAPARVPPPLRLAPKTEPLAVLAPAVEAAAGRIEAVQEWNAARRLPARIGFVRPLPLAPQIRFLPETTGTAPFSTVHPPGAVGAMVQRADGSRVWGGEVVVEEAHRLRLHLADLRLPQGVRMWVYGEKGEPVGPFGLELAHENALWTPSVEGPVARLEVELPATLADGDWRMRIDRVGELLDPSVAFPRGGGGDGEVDTSCLIDVQCVSSSTFPVVDAVERAIAHLEFPIDQQFFGVCTGGLLNDTASSETPYLLTANHCIDTQTLASGLEAFWDLKSDGCGGSAPSLSSVPRSNGATLLATGVSSDYTLLRLNSIPAGRAFLGWTANPSALQQDTVLHRVHHPAPDDIFVQTYTRLEYLPGNFNLCGVDDDGRNLDNPSFFHHGRLLASGSFGGSSGAPLMLGNGQVVGQLLGGCGPDPDEGCDDSNEAVDGAFSNSINALRAFLDVGSQGCVPDATTLCLANNRFQARVRWRTRQGTMGDGMAVQVTPTPDDSGLFYFFNEDNWEMLIKVLNGCPITDHYWVFFAATTNVEFTLTVTDTQRGGSKEYFNELGQRANAVTDTQALATCP
jgi:lysyl endopeptidase